ncbi:hypothetical protein CSIV_04960 [Microbacterium sp. CSI-V]|uniref:hypothetical protein n=1 Tax=Microbacterium sp. CSI-V TaxID=1933777 RepID=UPI00097CB3BA|nr:hypothetical protein [Microbacterium sp. CSI-V]ONI65632.1 hypothetical protein CSIV_04960 [Microbacterium sp. CSI-V]
MAKIRKDLIGSVLVNDPDGGDPIVLVAGDKVPDGVDLGDHVLANKSEDTKSSKAEEPPAGGDTGSPDAPAPSLPPRGGAGSGADAWRAYGVEAAKAQGLEIDIPSDATKTDIIDALKGAGIPVE